MAGQLAGLFASGEGGTQARTLLVGRVTGWVPATSRITVLVEDVTYVELMYMADPLAHDTSYAVGDQVLLAVTPGAPIVLGPLFNPTP